MSLPEQHVREFTRACVRAGLLSPDELHDEVAQAISAELPRRAEDADVLAQAWVEEAREELRRDQSGWPEHTDHERLQAAFAEIEAGDVVVLQGCEDHWSAKAVLDARAAAGKLPVVLFTAGGIATPADAAMMMQLGAEGVFVGSGIFKSGNPAQRAEAIVKATTFHDDPDVVAKVSRGLGEAMVGINVEDIPQPHRLAERGW